MTQDVGATLQAILDKLEKLDSIESAVKKIEANLKKLENRTRRLEDFQTTAKKDIEDLKEGINFTGHQLSDKTEALERTHRKYETQLTELTRNVCIASEKARMEIRVLFWSVSLGIKIVNRSSHWVTGLKVLTFKCSGTFPRKSLPAAKHRWKLLRMPGKMELLLPSANLNLINCTSEVNCGRSGKNLLRN